MHVYTFWWMSLERPKCGQSQLEASTPRQCAVFRPSVLKITSPSSFCFCASSFCSVSTRTALRKERGSAGQHVWACARYWSEFFGHAQHLEPTWIYTLFHNVPYTIVSYSSLQRPMIEKPRDVHDQPVNTSEGLRGMGSRLREAWSRRAPNVFYLVCKPTFAMPRLGLSVFLLRLHSVMHYWTMFCFGLYCHDSLELQVMNGARLHLAWGLHIS